MSVNAHNVLWSVRPGLSIVWPCRLPLQHIAILPFTWWWQYTANASNIKRGLLFKIMRHFKTNHEDERAENVKQMESILGKASFCQRTVLELIHGAFGMESTEYFSWINSIKSMTIYFLKRKGKIAENNSMISIFWLGGQPITCLKQSPIPAAQNSFLPRIAGGCHLRARAGSSQLYQCGLVQITCGQLFH